MLEPARKLATYEDLCALPEHLIGELIGGTLYGQPRPAGPHALVLSGLGIDLGGPFDRGRGGPGGWVIVDEPELHFGSDVLVPDMAGWRAGRLPAAEMKAAFFETAPDWVAEIASPSTTRIDRLLKMPLYARVGVDHLWLVEPVACIVEAFVRSGSEWTRLGVWGDESQARIPPFDAVPLDLLQLWERSRG